MLFRSTKAYIPLVSGNGNTLGVISAEKSDGFNMDDISRNFVKGGTFVENIKLGLEKEYQHQGRITDELTQMLNRQGLNEYLANTIVKAFAEGKQSMMINQIIKKVKKSKTLETIASELEEEEADIKPIYDAVVSSAPDYDINVIKDKLV